MNLVRANTTLMIGTSQTFPSLAAAWNHILNARVADGVYLHLYLSSANGSLEETFSSAFLLDHGSGARIAILSDNITKNSLFFSGCNGFIIDSGHSFNTLSGFKISAVQPPSNGTGIVATNQATISSVGIYVTDFPNGYEAANGGRLTVNSSLGGLVGFTSQAAYATSGGGIQFGTAFSITGPGPNSQCSGLVADTGGFIEAPTASISDCTDGILSSSNGFVAADNAQIGGCYYAIDAVQGGSVRVFRASLGSCASSGCTAENGGAIYAEDATIQNNPVGCNAQERGFIDCTGAVVSGNNEDLQALGGGMIDARQCDYSTKNIDGAAYGSFIE
jgi:predicted outer membrane repeat protein